VVAVAAVQLQGQTPTRPTIPTPRRPAPAPAPAPKPTTTQSPRDSLRTGRDSTRADSSKTRELIKWAETDSIAQALLTKPGYSATRYQGVHVRFDAKTRTLYLEGDPSGVERGQTLLVGDTIIYNDSTKLVVARGDTLFLRDPSQQTSDVVALGELRYNVEARRGTVTNISTKLETGEQWIVHGERASFVADTSRGKQTAFYVKNGSITSCDDSIPDYHFQSKEIKMISKNIMVARPAVLYIGDVPVMWLPFIFQDMRSGRRSGILTPRFGVSEIFRNSPTYRRHIDNLGYYFALSDYYDAQLSLDWRSGANSSAGDPGWVRMNGEWRYRWLDRFLTGRIGVSKLAQRDGTGNTAVSWGHQQDFSATSHLTMDLNYVTNTVVQRQTTFDPRQVLATIQSRASYQQQFGPASFSIGGDRRQYPGRAEVSQNFPNISISTPTIGLAKWLDWTPSLNFLNTEALKVNVLGPLGFRYIDRNGVRDSVQRTADSRETRLSFNTPIKIFGFNWQNSFNIADRENNSPTIIQLVDPENPGVTSERVFARTFSTEADWQTSFSLPAVLTSTFRVSPNISIANADGAHPYWVRTQLSGGQFVHQSKRLSYGLSAAPTFFGLFPGIGNVSRFRHTVSPSISFSYSPAATLSREYMSALNISPKNFIGSIAQEAVTLNLSTDLEAKMKTADTSSTAEGRKLKVVSLNFSPISYDIERKRQGHPGFATDRFHYDLSSDLLPGFRFGSTYSLFQGDFQSDTAVFKPFRTEMSAQFSLNNQSGIFAAISRIFGKAVPHGSPSIERLEPSPDDAVAQRFAATPIAGTSVRNQQYSIPDTRGWQASFSYNYTRQRAPTGNGLVIQQDPTAICAPFSSNPFVYQQCVTQQQTNPIGATPIGIITQGAAFIRQPPQQSINSQMSFHITPKWAASWSTMYDFTVHQFASQQVTLQRELHDWRSIFAFTRGPNGNFAFNFFIALNADPDIKFNYDKATYRPSQ
jgi:hypothetical protein